MTKSEKNVSKKILLDEKNLQDQKEKNSDIAEKSTPEEELKISQEKLLRTLAEMENQRRRFEKEKKDAYEFGGFNFARETLALLDNLERAQVSIKNDEILKNSKDLEKFLKNQLLKDILDKNENERREKKYFDDLKNDKKMGGKLKFSL